jgi:hypothetical protein
MGALTSLNLANNNLGELVLPEGWTQQVNSTGTGYEYKHIDGTVQKARPGKPEGIIAIANAIKDMGAAMSSLNLADNGLGDDDLASIVHNLKMRAIEKKCPCLTCLVAHESMTTDFRALLEATKYFKRCPPAIDTDDLWKGIVQWLK